MAQIIGIDGGNNTVITAMDGKDPLIIPTILAPYHDYNQGLEMLEPNIKALKDVLDAEIILNHSNDEQRRELGRFYVGSLAKEMEGINTNERSIGKGKRGDLCLLICILTSLAAAVSIIHGVSKGKIQEQIKIVTGLPFLQFKNDRDSFAKQFLGEHKVFFRGLYDIEVDLHVTDVEVEMEGAGALNKLIFNDSGEYLYKEEELIDRTILGVEIGEFTSEIIAITFKEVEDGKIIPEYKQKLCMGIDMGIANAKQPIIDFIRDRYNTIIDRYDIDMALKRRFRKGELDLENGETINIVKQFEDNLIQIANGISALINNKVKNSGEKGRIKHTLLYGGGVCVLDYKMGNILKEKMFEIVGGKSSIVETPHLANAISYLDKAKLIYGDGNKSKTQKPRVNVKEQKRVLFDPHDNKGKKPPRMPLQIILQDSGLVGEAKTVRGASAVIIGNEYLEAADSISEWNMRVEAAKKEAAKSLNRGLKAVVYDARSGIIENPLLSDNSNTIKPDNADEPVKIRVENDRLFILSLVKLGLIRVLERKDSFFFRPHQKWNVLLQSNGALQCCSNCLHRIADKRIICPVYNVEKEQTDGTDCGSYAIYPGSYIDEYTSGEYIDITEECPVDDLFKKVGQLWMLENNPAS